MSDIFLQPLEWAQPAADEWESTGAAEDIYSVTRSRASDGWVLWICKTPIEGDFDTPAEARDHASEDWSRRMSLAFDTSVADTVEVADAGVAGQIAFERDQWMMVTTNSKETARKFFGVEATREVQFRGFSTDPEKPGRIFAVKSRP
jgi:hypothetical protein